MMVNVVCAGPYDVIIDGANVALFGQNFADGGFSMQQIQLMLEEVEAFKPGAKTLLV